MSDRVTISLDTETKKLLSQINLSLKHISQDGGLSEEVQRAILNIEKHLKRLADKQTNL